MVCSRGKAPTQSQLFHFQRANVALSRARDQCILVRSLDITEVPSNDDVKIPIIEFFQTFGGSETESGEPVACVQLQNSQPAQLLLAELLTEQGFTVRSMGIVWKNGICIEHPESDMRAAVMVDCAEELLQHWHASYSQQKAIERVGWKCLRVDILSLLTDCTGTLDSIIRFLSVSGVEAPPVLYDALEDEDETSAHGNEGAPIEVEDQDDNREDEVPVIELVDHDGDAGLDPLAVDNFALPDAGDIVIISTDDEEMDSKPPAKVKPEPVASASFDVDSDDVDASNFGCVLDLAFLRGVVEKNSGGSDSDEYKADQSDGGEISPRRAAKRRRKYRRVEKYQRDGSWYPNRDAVDDDPEGQLND